MQMHRSDEGEHRKSCSSRPALSAQQYSTSPWLSPGPSLLHVAHYCPCAPDGLSNRHWEKRSSQEISVMSYEGRSYFINSYGYSALSLLAFLKLGCAAFTLFCSYCSLSYILASLTSDERLNVIVLAQKILICNPYSFVRFNCMDGPLCLFY